MMKLCSRTLGIFEEAVTRIKGDRVMNIRFRLHLFTVALVFLMAAGCWTGGPVNTGGDDFGAVRKSAREADIELERSRRTDGEERGDGDLEPDLERDMGQEDALEPSDEDARDEPAWITSPPSGDRYVYGVGSAEIYSDSASAINRAQDDARAEILKQLEVTVSGETRTSVSRSVKDGESRMSRSVMDWVKTAVPETRLTHVEVADTYVDKEAKVGYALVRFDRKAAESDLVSRIKEIDRQLREIAALEINGPRLKELKSLAPALPLFEERQETLAMLERVTSGNYGHRLPQDLRELEDRIAALLDSLIVELNPRGSGDDEMTAGLRKALTAQGVRVRENGKGDIVLRYAVEQRLVEQDGVKFVFARSSVTVLDENGDVIDEFQKEVKDASRAAAS